MIFFYVIVVCVFFSVGIWLIVLQLLWNCCFMIFMWFSMILVGLKCRVVLLVCDSFVVGLILLGCWVLF